MVQKQTFQTIGTTHTRRITWKSGEKKARWYHAVIGWKKEVVDEKAKCRTFSLNSWSRHFTFILHFKKSIKNFKRNNRRLLIYTLQHISLSMWSVGGRHLPVLFISHHVVSAPKAAAVCFLLGLWFPVLRGDRRDFSLFLLRSLMVGECVWTHTKPGLSLSLRNLLCDHNNTLRSSPPPRTGSATAKEFGKTS